MIIDKIPIEKWESLKYPDLDTKRRDIDKVLAMKINDIIEELGLDKGKECICQCHLPLVGSVTHPKNCKCHSVRCIHCSPETFGVSSNQQSSFKDVTDLYEHTGLTKTDGKLRKLK